MHKPLDTKTFIISMFLILLSGLGFIGGIYYIVSSPTFTPTPTYGLNSQPVTSEPQAVSLTLSSPENNILVFNPDLLIQGKTTPNSTVLLSLNDSDQTLEIGKKGDFSTTIQLKNGLNQVDVIAFDSLGNNKAESKVVYYSPEKL